MKSLAAKLVVLTHAHPSVHVNTILHVAPLFKFVLLGVHHVHTGTVVSTVTALLALVTAFVFHAASLTFHAANLNVTVPFTFDFAVYVNVYVFPFVASVTVAALNVTCALLNVIALAARLVVLIALHVLVHVNATLPVSPAFNNVFVGCVLIVQLGTILSTVTALLVFVAAPFHAVSYTLFAGNVNVTVPFTLAFAV